ncbi:lipopolysaccharide cholinephosphotransferase [Streptococcus pneumoniae]|nr:lipopolysaccharide cholinephosphotransferase [Streptococcus pneumoniae]
MRNAVWLLLRPVSHRYVENNIEKEIKKYSHENGQYMAFIPSKFKEKEVFPSGTFDKTIKLPFENLSLPAPEKFDTILTQLYGYMTLPPEEKRFYSHEFHAYKLED